MVNKIYYTDKKLKTSTESWVRNKKIAQCHKTKSKRLAKIKKTSKEKNQRMILKKKIPS